MGPAGPQGPQGVQGPASLLGSAVSSTFDVETFVNDAVGCDPLDIPNLQMIGAMVEFTLDDVNENQRVTVASNSVIAAGAGADAANLVLDLCYSTDGGLTAQTEGLWVGPLALSASTTMPFSLVRTFGEQNTLVPGTYQFGLCGCVDSDALNDAWNVNATVVSGQWFQQ